MIAAQARTLGTRIAAVLSDQDVKGAYGILAPVLAERTPFRLLDLIGAGCTEVPINIMDSFLNLVAEERTEGGWVVIAAALNAARENGSTGILERCRSYIIAGDVWYAADIFAERVPGPALLGDFYGTLASLDAWRSDPNHWVRRAVGVAIHFWAKRSGGDTNLKENAHDLLQFLEPMFTEWNMDAAKGIAWGLKTLGRYYPDSTSTWLEGQLRQEGHRYRAIMLRKALTYLPPEEQYRLRRV